MAPGAGSGGALRVVVTQLDLNQNVEFKDVRFHLYVNVLVPSESRPFVELRAGDLAPDTAYGRTMSGTLPLHSEQTNAILENTRGAPGEPSLIITMLHVTRNQVGQKSVTEQGVAVVPLQRGLGTRTTVAFHTTYENFNRASTTIRTSHGVLSSASIACTVGLQLDAPGYVATGRGRVAAPRVCDNSAVPISRTSYMGRLAEYQAAVGSRKAVRENLDHINFAQFVTSGCELPGWAFCQNAEKQPVDDAVIEQATVFACLMLAPRPVNAYSEQLNIVRECLSTPFVCARPTAIFQAALQLPAVSMVYMLDNTMVPSDFPSQQLVMSVDGHRYGQTDSFRKAEYGATDSIEDAAAAVDCEDGTNLTADDMGLMAQDYVLRHAGDDPSKLSHWVARALAPVLEYVPCFAHNSLDETDPNSHMAAVFVRRSVFPHEFHAPPWGQSPASLAQTASNLPPALYMDGVYFTPDVPVNKVALPIVRAVADSITAGNNAVETHVKVTDLLWTDTKSPANDFVVGRLFTDVRCFQPRGSSWLEPAIGERVPSRLVPMWVPVDRHRPGTYGVRLRDLCLHGVASCELVPYTVPLKLWNETMQQLEWCHPPVPLTLRADRAIKCQSIKQPSGQREADGPALTLPLVIRRSSFTNERASQAVQAAMDAAPGAPCRVWHISGALCNIAGYIDVVDIQF